MTFQEISIKTADLQVLFRGPRMVRLRRFRYYIVLLEYTLEATGIHKTEEDQLAERCRIFEWREADLRATGYMARH